VAALFHFVRVKGNLFSFQLRDELIEAVDDCRIIDRS